MGILMIATIFDGRDIIGLKLYNMEDGAVRDVTYDSVVKALKMGVEVDNIKLTSNNKIVPIEGELINYPTIVNGKIYGRFHIVILEEYDTGIYKVTNGMEASLMSAEEVFRYSLSEGLANAYISEDGIRPLIGDYFPIGNKLRAKRRGKGIGGLARAVMHVPYEINDNNILIKVDDVDTLILPEGISGIAAGAISNLENLRVIKLPDTLSCINRREFEGCKKLEVVHLSKSMDTIPVRAFKDCISLAEITLPYNIRTVRNSAFIGCSKLKRIYTMGQKVNFEVGAYRMGVKVEVK